VTEIHSTVRAGQFARQERLEIVDRATGLTQEHVDRVHGWLESL